MKKLLSVLLAMAMLLTPVPLSAVMAATTVVPSTTLVTTPQVGVDYKFGMVQENVSTTDVYYLAGGMSGYYMASTTDANAAIDVRLINADGGYHLYSPTVDQYINMVVSGTHVNGAYADAPSTVYTYDTEAQTVVSYINDHYYWFGTRNDKSYTTVGPVDKEYNGFYCCFYSVDTAAPEEPTIPEEPVEPEEPEEPVGTGMSVDFTDIANRVSYSPEQQVWACNGVTVTNDKAASVSNVGDYGGEGYPARFYKNSSVLIECAGMIKIEFLCDDYKESYVTDLMKSILIGAVTADGTLVTVTLDEPVDALFIENLVAQVRLDSITVYSNTITEPEVPEEPEAPEEPEVPVKNVLTIPEANELGLSHDPNTYTADKYYVTGTIAAVSNSIYGNMYIVDEDNNQFMIYGSFSADGSIRYGDMEYLPVVGDTITVYGIIGTYNGNEAQMKNGWITEIIKGESVEDTDPEADSELTVAEAINLALSKLHNIYTENKYYVTGEVVEIYNEIYGNMRITDADGNILTLYGTYSADGSLRYDAMGTKPKVGDTVTVYGVIGQYNNAPQMKNGWIQSITPSEPDTPVTTEEILDAAFALQPGESLPYEVFLTGTVITVEKPYDAVYNHLTVGIRVEDRYIVCYRMQGIDLDVIKAGDTIGVYGTLTNYNGTVEFNYPQFTRWSNGYYEPVAMEMITNPQAGVAYKLGIVEEHLSTTDVYYLVGEKNGHYLETSNSTYGAVDVYLEKTVGGYYIYIDYFGTKKYINMVEDPDNGYINAFYESTPTTVYTYDASRNTMTAIAPNGVLHALGSHNYDNYTTIHTIQMGSHYYAHFYVPEGTNGPDVWGYLTYEIQNGEAIITGYTDDLPADVVIPDTIEGYPVVAFADNVFYGCDTIVTLTLPASVERIGTVFFNCPSLEAFIVAEDNPFYSVLDGVLYDKEQTMVIRYPDNKTGAYAMPDSVIDFAAYAFAGNPYLTEITIPDGVKQIAMSTFKGCTSLKTVTLPESIVYVWPHAFANTSVADVYYAGSEEEYADIWFDSGNDPLINATWHYNWGTIIAGDVNGDGKIGIVDLALLQRYLNGWDVTIVEPSSDVNADGSIGVLDWALIQRYLNGWDVELLLPQ